MDLGLSGKVALVTGASRGLGRAVSDTLASEGASVAMASRDENVLAETATAIRVAHGGETFSKATDVTNESAVNELVSAVLERFGRIDVLVANAGGPPASQFQSTELEQWRAGIELNLFSTLYLCRAVVPHMRQRQSGRIVAITSISVKQPVDGLILSNTARAGVAGLMKSMSNELAPYGITVNVACPGYTKTERLVELAGRMSEQQNVSVDAIVDKWNAQIPMGRLGEPSEFASVVAFLCSDRASYVTGTCLAIDGGVVKSIV